MSFINSLGRKISQTSHEVLQKTKETAEIIKYNNLISEEEKHLEQLFACLGKAFYEQTYDICLEKQPDTVAEIKESQAKLQDYKEHIRTVKGIINCPHCGQELSPDVAFCSACGFRLEAEQPPSSILTSGRVCPECGTPMPEEFLFCIQCGAAYQQPAETENPTSDPDITQEPQPTEADVSADQTEDT